MIVVAEILRPRGNRGEVLATSQTDVPGRLETLRAANVRLRDGSDTAVTLESAWPHKEHWVLKFAGVGSIDAAEKFRGGDLWVQERGRLSEGWFRSDLMGCGLRDAATGALLGKVEGWQDCNGSTLMESTVDGREVLIPFAAATCRVNLDDRVIDLDVPEGLLEL